MQLRKVFNHSNAYLYANNIKMGNPTSKYIVAVGLVIVIALVIYGYYRDSKDKYTQR